jgi:DNA-binding IclR family transcriptional regulator
LDDRTRRTITDRGDLVVEIGTVRLRKFALDNGENEDGVLCVGAPVFDYRGVVVGAISVSAPAFFFKEEEARALAPLVIEAADEVSLALGTPRELLLNSPGEPSLAARVRGAET